MIKNVIQDLGGIGVYGVISVCLFATVFTIALIWALLLKQPFLKSMSVLPLDEGGQPAPGAGPGSEPGMERAGRG